MRYVTDSLVLHAIRVPDEERRRDVDRRVRTNNDTNEHGEGETFKHVATKEDEHEESRPYAYRDSHEYGRTPQPCR
jgi:hypothetical protein